MYIQSRIYPLHVIGINWLNNCSPLDHTHVLGICACVSGYFVPTSFYDLDTMIPTLAPLKWRVCHHTYVINGQTSPADSSSSEEKL